MLKKLRKLLFYLVLLEFSLILILLSIKLIKLNDKYNKLKEELITQETISKLYYEDILQLIEGR